MVEQSYQSMGGDLIPLLRSKLQSRERLDDFGEPLLSGGSFAVGPISKHEDDWRQVGQFVLREARGC